MSKTPALGKAAQTSHAAVLRPLPHLFRRGLTVILALTTPVFALLYWVAIPGDAWAVVLIAQFALVGAAILCLRALVATTITLGVGGVCKRAPFGRSVVVRPADVASILLVNLYETSTLDTLPQLFVTGHDGQTLLRMRGQFWALDEMERVAEELEAPVTRPAESMTLTQLRRAWPGVLAWWERGMWLR